MNVTQAQTQKYRDYLTDHIANVEKAYDWLAAHIGIPEEIEFAVEQNVLAHDRSKYSTEEFYPYAAYFYSNEQTKDIQDEFDYAWLHHIHNNPHHWQYWLLQNDEDGLKILDMPDEYIYEMVCDHWAFSWKSGNLKEIFNWYEKNKNNMQLSKVTRQKYEALLEQIKKQLD